MTICSLMTREGIKKGRGSKWYTQRCINYARNRFAFPAYTTDKLIHRGSSSDNRYPLQPHAQFFFPIAPLQPKKAKRKKKHLRPTHSSIPIITFAPTPFSISVIKPPHPIFLPPTQNANFLSPFPFHNHHPPSVNHLDESSRTYTHLRETLSSIAISSSRRSIARARSHNALTNLQRIIRVGGEFALRAR